jgi:uncharacterized C2H2 Zn-finger protein
MTQPIELQQATQETVTVKMEHAASISQQQPELDLSLLYKCLGPNFNPNLSTLDSSLHFNSALVCSGSTTEPIPNSLSALSINENSDLTEVKKLERDWLKGNDVITAHLNPSQSESQLTVTQQAPTSLPAFSLAGGQQSRVAVIRPITANQKLAGDQLTTTTSAAAATVKDIVTSPYKGKVKVKPNNKVIKIVTCDACDMLFSSKAAYKRHRIVHRTSEPHQCPHCDATFKLKVRDLIIIIIIIIIIKLIIIIIINCYSYLKNKMPIIIIIIIINNNNNIDNNNNNNNNNNNKNRQFLRKLTKFYTITSNVILYKCNNSNEASLKTAITIR